jgi:hypothetical protein
MESVGARFPSCQGDSPSRQTRFAPALVLGDVAAPVGRGAGVYDGRYRRIPDMMAHTSVVNRAQEKATMATQSSAAPTTAKVLSPAKTAKRFGLLDKYFYFGMSLLVAVVVVYGFSHTVNENLIHAMPPRPWVLWVHGAVFSSWVVFFIFQSALVRTHHVRVHRVTGWFGVGLGVVIPVLGISTAIAMARFDILHFHTPDAQRWGVTGDHPCFSQLCSELYIHRNLLE